MIVLIYKFYSFLYVSLLTVSKNGDGFISGCNAPRNFNSFIDLWSNTNPTKGFFTFVLGVTPLNVGLQLYYRAIKLKNVLKSIKNVKINLSPIPCSKEWWGRRG